jgi:hypothetical protein
VGIERLDEWQADGYRAIGRWWVQFSRLVGGMRTQMENRLRSPEDEHGLASVAFSQATAMQISAAFFGMCRLVGDLSDAEENIARQLQKEVDDVIRLRNKIGHGDWLIGQDIEPNSILAHLIRFYPKAPHRRVETLTAKDLDARSDRLGELARMVWLFGGITLAGQVELLTVNGLAKPGEYRVSDVLIAENVPKGGNGGRIAIAGPRASELL